MGRVVAVVLAVMFILGIIAVGYGLSLYHSGSQLKKQGESKIEDGQRLLNYNEIIRSGTFPFTITDENPFYPHEIGKLFQSNEIRVRFDSSRSGFIIGIMDKGIYESKEETELKDQEKVKANSDPPTYTIPEWIDRERVTRFDGIEIRFVDGLSGTIPPLKPREAEPYAIVIMYVLKEGEVPGNITGKVEYEVVNFPEKDKGQQLIQEGRNLVNIGDSKMETGLFEGVIGGGIIVCTAILTSISRKHGSSKLLTN